MTINISWVRALIHRFSGKKKTDRALIQDQVALVRTNAAWEEYLRGEGTLITSSEELKDYLKKI
jgi:hypothetical protein